MGATDVEAEGPYEFVRLGASSTSFNSDERKLGPVVVFSSFGLALELAAPTRDDSPFWFCWARAASSCGLLVRGRFSLRWGSVGSGDGDMVGSFRFLAALGLFSISRALSKAFQARISSKDSG